MRELEDVLQSLIDKFSDHHHQKRAQHLKTVIEVAKLLKFPEGEPVEDLRAAMNTMNRSLDGLRWARLMDAREETKIKTYLSLATISMAIIAIPYCANLPMLRVQTNLSELSPAPGAALPSISDIICEDRKRMLKPVLLGAISLILCLLGIINSRWRTYTRSRVVLAALGYPARVSCDDRLVQAYVLLTTYTFFILSFNNFRQVVTRKLGEALNHTGASLVVYVVGQVLLLLMSFFTTSAAIGYLAFIRPHGWC
jgi:hypothetical protein